MRRKLLLFGTLLVFVLSLVTLWRIGTDRRCVGEFLAFTCDVGVCASCGGSTASGMFRFCRPCAKKRGLCLECGGASHPFFARVFGR